MPWIGLLSLNFNEDQRESKDLRNSWCDSGNAWCGRFGRKGLFKRLFWLLSARQIDFFPSAKDGRWPLARSWTFALRGPQVKCEKLRGTRKLVEKLRCCAQISGSTKNLPKPLKPKKGLTFVPLLLSGSPASPTLHKADAKNLWPQ